MTHTTHHKKWFIFALVWLIFLLYALLIKPPSAQLPNFPNADKLAHTGLFFGQFWLIGHTIKTHTPSRYWAIGMGLAFTLAIGSEMAQGFLTTYRAMEFWDGMADIIGASIALSLLQWTNTN